MKPQRHIVKRRENPENSQQNSNLRVTAEEFVPISAKSSPTRFVNQQMRPILKSQSDNATSSSSSSTPQPEGGSQYSLENFKIERCLHRGKFGSVYLALEKKSEFVTTLKSLFKKHISDQNLIQQVHREIVIQRELQHINILKLYGFFSDDQSIYLMLEHAPNGTLFELLKAEKRFNETQATEYIKATITGLRYLHEKSIIHGNIMPSNLFLSHGCVLKIGGFRWSVSGVKVTDKNLSRNTLCGTMDYMSPEIVMGTPYGKATDLWSLGVLTYERELLDHL